MGSLNPSPRELSLDFRQSFIPKTIGRFLEQVARIDNVTEKLSQVDDFVNQLELEMRKIEAVKGEFPLCMLIIKDVIDVLKNESMMLQKTLMNPEPVLEEFIPLKNNCNDDSKVEIIANQKDIGDKRDWLKSTQLWSTNANVNQKENPVEKISLQGTGEEDDRRPGIKIPVRGNGGSVRPPPPQLAATRKERRCWSTELHRRFLCALQELGGSQAATPKQIRDLMQVDGLTNDEVKSHLQKYRLHTRRNSSPNTNQSVGGSLWMPLQDEYGGSSKCSNSQSGSPNGPLSNDGNNMNDEDEKSENYCWNGNL